MKYRTSKTMLLAILTCVLSLATPSLHAFLASVKAAGMGLTGAAYPQDALAGSYNPAGATEVGDRLDVGISIDRFKGKGTIRGNTFPFANVNGTFDGTRTDIFVTPDFGINKEFCVYDFPMSVGLVVYNREFTKTTYKNAFPLLGTSKLKLEFLREEISPVWAMKINDCHSIGVSLNIYVQRLKVNGIQNFERFSSRPGHVTNRGYDYSEGVGVTVGYLGQWTDWLSVGLAYTPKTKMSRFDKYSGFAAQHGRLDVTPFILGGIALRFWPCSTFTFDVQHNWYNRGHAIHNPLLPNLVTSELGDTHGVGFGWKNQTIYRFGVDYQLCDDWTFRAGYRYGKTPISPSQTAVNLLTLETVEQYATFGASWAITCCSEISAFYAHGFNNRVRGSGSIPPGPPLFGGEVDLRAHKDIVGISYGYCY